MHSCLADDLDAAGRGTKAPAFGDNGDPCLCSIPALVRVKKAECSSLYAWESHKESLLYGWKISLAEFPLLFTDCQHPVMKLTLQHLQQLGKCYDPYFTSGKTEALNREVVCLRFYAARAGKVNSHEVVLTVPVLSCNGWIPPVNDERGQWVRLRWSSACREEQLPM